MRAAGLARRSGARVVMVHVVSPESAPVDFDGLQRTVAPLLEGIEVQPLLRRGPVAREILAAARSENADLIVLTRHGRWQSASDLGFSRFLLHSVLCRILLDANCPVWVEPETGAPPQIAHVLCGIASPVHDRETIGHAAGIAALLEARLSLFRNSLGAAIAVPGQQELTQAWQREVAAAVRADLEALRESLGVCADVRVGTGGFVSALLRETAGLIAVRRTSRDWGSDETLHPLVRGADVPLLVYPGELRPLRAAPPAKPFRIPRLAGPLLLVLVLLLGVWAIHGMFVRARQPDCEREAYRCAFRQNLIYTTQDRINQPQPKADPKLGPFNQAPPTAGSHPAP